MTLLYKSISIVMILKTYLFKICNLEHRNGNKSGLYLWFPIFVFTAALKSNCVQAPFTTLGARMCWLTSTSIVTWHVLWLNKERLLHDWQATCSFSFKGVAALILHWLDSWLNRKLNISS